jgi:NAD+ diphosphatase
MLVERMFSDGIPRCLLGRQASWDDGVYSTLAGFVDPGETLEEAVIREVLEETSIHATDPQYCSSQPWPFPASVMLGFTAEATSETIDISDDDLEDAQWFSREQLVDFSINKKNQIDDNQISTNQSDKNHKQDQDNQKTTAKGYKMSSSDSISSYLITAWKNKEIGKY